MENICPDAFGRPPHKPVVEGFVRPVEFWRVRPAASGLKDMDNPADHPAVINPGLATGISWKKRLKPRKLVVIEPKTLL